MIISASRRTDIPCYYSEWLLNRLKEGYVLVPNPRNANRLGRVELSPQQVDCIVFWTKNPAPMMRHRLPLIDGMGYTSYFEFTITAYGREAEPNLPEKQTVLDTFKRLSDQIGPYRVDWRFDPIMKKQQVSDSWIADQFEWLCRELHDYTERCIISFVDEYKHTGNRTKALSSEEMLKTAEIISQIAGIYRLPVFSCAEEIDLSSLGIEHASCIDQKKVEQLTGSRIAAKKDAGQRPACRCMESIDIGAYDTCGNGCTYCYAVTSEKTLKRKLAQHDPNSPLLTGFPRGTELITDRSASSLKIDQVSLFE